MKQLDVSIEINGRQREVGVISGSSDYDASFCYSEHYLDSGTARPISISLPLTDKPYGPEPTRRFFEGLLPEGFMRRTVAEQNRTDDGDYLSILEMLGADSINPVRDIQLQMLAAMRQAVDCPIDIHTENPKSTGGFIRHYEVPEMIRIAAPIYLKTGGSVAATHSWDSTEDDARKRAKQCALVKRMIDSYYPEAIWSPKGSLI